MATPIVLSTGSESGAGTPGEGRNDLVIGETVTLSDEETENDGSSYSWEFEDIPLDSNASLSDPNTSSPSFSPDVTGSYRIRCTVDSSEFDVEVFAVPLPVTDARIPSFGEELEYDADGNDKGWHQAITGFMRSVDAAVNEETDSLIFNQLDAGEEPGLVSGESRMFVYDISDEIHFHHRAGSPSYGTVFGIDGERHIVTTNETLFLNNNLVLSREGGGLGWFDHSGPPIDGNLGYSGAYARIVAFPSGNHFDNSTEPELQLRMDGGQSNDGVLAINSEGMFHFALKDGNSKLEFRLEDFPQSVNFHIAPEGQPSVDDNESMQIQGPFTWFRDPVGLNLLASDPDESDLRDSAAYLYAKQGEKSVYAIFDDGDIVDLTESGDPLSVIHVDVLKGFSDSSGPSAGDIDVSSDAGGDWIFGVVIPPGYRIKALKARYNKQEGDLLFNLAVMHTNVVVLESDVMAPGSASTNEYREIVSGIDYDVLEGQYFYVQCEFDSGVSSPQRLQGATLIVEPSP